MLHRYDGTNPLSHDAALAVLTKWFRDGEPIAAIAEATSTARDDLIAHLMQELIQRASGAPDVLFWVRVSADGEVTASTGAPKTALPELAAAVRRPAELGAPRRLLVVDDFGTLPRHLSRLVDPLLRADELRAANARVLLCGDTAPEVFDEADAPLLVRLESLHRWTEVPDRIVQWALDPFADDVLVVTGAPGSGKSVLLDQTVSRLQQTKGVRVPYALIRRGSMGAGGIAIDRLVNGLRTTKAALDSPVNPRPNVPPLPEGRVDNTIHGNADRVVMAGSINSVTINNAPDTVSTLITELNHWAATDTDRPVLVLVVDAVDELEVIAGDGIEVLRSILARRPRFAEWRLKILLSAQALPPSIPAQELTLSDTAEIEIARYATAELGPRDGERVATLSRGLFLVAADLVAQVRAGTPLPAEETEARALGAAAHIAATIHTLDGTRAGEEAKDWPDVLRVVLLAALVPWGLTDSQMARLWHASGTDGQVPATRWPWGHELLRRVASSPVRRYLVMPTDPEGRFALLHPAVREGVLAMCAHRSFAPGYGVSDERDRFLCAFTPLGGDGPGWDAKERRFAVAAAPGMLADLLLPAQSLGQASGQPPPALNSGNELPRDAGQLSRDLDRVRAMVERWSWLEECVAADDDPTMPLGVTVAVAEIGRLLTALAAVGHEHFELWAGDLDADQDDPRVAATPVAVPIPRSSAPARSVYRTSYATIRNPTIEAVVTGSYAFPDRERALDQLAVLARHFTLSNRHDYEADPTQLVLYIRGYCLTAERGAKFHKGAFARITVEEAGEHWTLRAQLTDEDVPPSEMPERAYPPAHGNRAHPNWGHPVLRRVRANENVTRKPYRDWDAASDDLKLLHTQYSGTSIPIPGQLRIIVWDPARKQLGKNSAHKIILFIVSDEDGKFVIRWRSVPAKEESA